MISVNVSAMESLEASEDQNTEITVNESQGMKRKISLASCGACGTGEARYRCPGCLKHSCSLPCVKKHKSESGCSGVRDKTSFVPLSQFDEMNILNDYRLLEDTGRLADSVNRGFSLLPPSRHRNGKLLKQGARRFNLDLRLLPNGFTRRLENSTYYNKREKQFFWHLKLLFPQSSSEYTQRRVPESRTLQEILTEYLHPTESEPVRRQKLKAYVRAPFDHVRVFMKVENRRSNSVRYHELDLQKTLLDNLRNKTIIEYPVLHVVLMDHSENYVLLQQEAAYRGPAQPCVAQNDVALRGVAVESEAKELKTAPGDEVEEGELRDDDDGVEGTARS